MAIVLAPFVRFYLKDYGRFADVQSKTKVSHRGSCHRSELFSRPSIAQNDAIEQTSFPSWQYKRNEKGRSERGHEHD